MGFFSSIEELLKSFANSLVKYAPSGGPNSAAIDAVYQIAKEKHEKKQAAQKEAGATDYTPYYFGGIGSMPSSLQEQWKAQNQNYLDRVKRKHPEADEITLNNFYDNKFKQQILQNSKDESIASALHDFQDGHLSWQDLQLKVAQTAIGKDLDAQSDRKDQYKQSNLTHLSDWLFSNEASHSLRDDAKDYLSQYQKDTGMVDSIYETLSSSPEVKRDGLKQFDELSSQLYTEYDMANHPEKYKDLQDYDKMKDVECLRMDDDERLHLLAKYYADVQLGGEELAVTNLQNYYKDKIHDNQSNLDVVLDTGAGIIDAAASMLIGTVGILDGLTGGHISSLLDAYAGWSDEEDLQRRKGQGYLQGIYDNALVQFSNDLITTHVYDRKVQRRMKKLGISDNTLNKSSEQEGELFNSLTLPELLQQYGFEFAATIISLGGAGLISGTIRGGLGISKVLGATNNIKNFNNLLRAAVKGKNALNIANGAIIATTEGAQITQQDKVDNYHNMLEDTYDRYIKNTINQNPNLIQQYLQNSAADDETLAKIPQGTLVKGKDGGFYRTFNDADKKNIASLVAQNDSLKNSIIQIYTRQHPEEVVADMQAIRDIAEDAGAVELAAQSAINGILEMGFKSTLHSKGVQNARANLLRKVGISPKDGLSQHINLNRGADGTWSASARKVSKSSLVKDRFKEALGEGWEEYIQDVGSGFGKGYSESAYQQFIDAKYGDKEGVNSATEYSIAQALGAGLSKAGEEAASFESIRDGIYGGLSSALGGVNINQSRGGLKNSGIKGNLLERISDKSPVAWRGLWTPLLNGTEAKMQQSYNERLADNLNSFFQNKEVQEKLSSVEGTMSFLKQYKNALENDDEFAARNAEFGQMFSILDTLNRLKGTAYYDSVMDNLDARAEFADFSDEQIKEQLQDESSDAAKLLRQYKTDYDNKSGNTAENMDVSPTDENVEKVRRIAKNAIEMKQALEDAAKQREQVQKDFQGEVDDDGIAAIVFQNLAIKNAEARMEQIDKELSRVQDFDTGNRTDAENSAVALYGSRTALNREKEQLKQKIESAQKKLLSDRQIKNLSQKVEKRERLSVEEQELILQHRQAAQELASMNKRLSLLDKHDKALKRHSTGKIVSHDNQIDIAEEAVPVLSAREIMQLHPSERRFMLDPKNFNLYSKEQQAVITELNNRGNQLYGKDWQKKLEDRSRLQAFRDSNLKEQNKLLESSAALTQYINNAKVEKATRLRMKQYESLFEDAEDAELMSSDEGEKRTSYSRLTDWLFKKSDDPLDEIAKRRLLQKYDNAAVVQKLKNHLGKNQELYEAVKSSDEYAEMTEDQKELLENLFEQSLVEDIDVSDIDALSNLYQETLVNGKRTNEQGEVEDYAYRQGTPQMERLRKRMEAKRQAEKKEGENQADVYDVLFALKSAIEHHRAAQLQNKDVLHDVTPEGEKHDKEVSETASDNAGTEQETNNSQASKQDTARQKLQSIYNQIVSLLKKAGITVHNKAEMDAFLKEHGADNIQEFVEAYGRRKPYDNHKKSTEAERKDLLSQIRKKSYENAGTDALKVGDRIFLVDHSSNENLDENLKDGDGFGIRNVYNLKNLTQDDVKEIIRNIGADFGHSETRVLRYLQNLGIGQGLLSGVDIAAELKMGVSPDASVGDKNGRERNQSGDDRSGAESRGNTRVLSEENGRGEIQELRISIPQNDSFNRGVHTTLKSGRKVDLVLSEPIRDEKAGTITYTIGRKVDGGEVSNIEAAGIVLRKDEIDWEKSSANEEAPADYDEYPIRAHQIIITDDGKIFAEATNKEGRYTLKSNPLETTSFENNPQGELYGFVYNGEIYLDETKLSPNAAIHEYTHLWDTAIKKRNPELWNRGKELMKQLDLWKEIDGDESYGRKWRDQGKTEQEIEDLIASEVHARLTGADGERLLQRQAKKTGSDSIIEQLLDWLLDVWYELVDTFNPLSSGKLDSLTLGEFNRMTLRDFFKGVNPMNASQSEQQKSSDRQMQEVTRKRRAEGRPFGRPMNPGAFNFESLNMQAILEDNSPETASLREFIERYGILDYLNTHATDLINKKQVVFARLSEIHREDELNDYDEARDMPIVALVELSKEEIGERCVTLTDAQGATHFYQPIGIMPSTGDVNYQGSDQMEMFRKNAVPDTLITDHNGRVLRTTVLKVPSQLSSSETPTDFNQAIFNTVMARHDETARSLKPMEDAPMLRRSSDVWKSLRDKFLRNLRIKKSDGHVIIVYPVSRNKSEKEITPNVYVNVRITPMSSYLLPSGESLNEALLNMNPEVLQLSRLKGFIDALRTHKWYDKQSKIQQARLISSLENNLYPAKSKGFRWDVLINEEDDTVTIRLLQGNDIKTQHIISGNPTKLLRSEDAQLTLLRDLLIDPETLDFVSGNDLETDNPDAVLFQINYKSTGISQDEKSDTQVNEYLRQAVDEGLLTINRKQLVYQSYGAGFRGIGAAENTTANSSTVEPSKEDMASSSEGELVDSVTGASYGEVEGKTSSLAELTDEQAQAKADDLVAQMRKDAKSFREVGKKDGKAHREDHDYKGVTTLAEGQFNGSAQQKLVSSAIGNTMDKFAKDFFSNSFVLTDSEVFERGKRVIKKVYQVSTPKGLKPLSSVYPNMSEEALQKVAASFQMLKDTHPSWKFYPDITTWGMKTHLDETTGENKTDYVVGVLDLLVYDTLSRKFRIIDIKTSHSNTLSEETERGYRKQVTLYGELLTKQWGGHGFELDSSLPFYLMHIPMEYPAIGTYQYRQPNESNPQLHILSTSAFGKQSEMPLRLSKQEVGDAKLKAVMPLSVDAKTDRENHAEVTFLTGNIDKEKVSVQEEKGKIHDRAYETVTLSTKDGLQVIVNKQEGREYYTVSFYSSQSASKNWNILFEQVRTLLPENAVITLQNKTLGVSMQDLNLLAQLGEGWTEVGETGVKMPDRNGLIQAASAPLLRKPETASLSDTQTVDNFKSLTNVWQTRVQSENATDTDQKPAIPVTLTEKEEAQKAAIIEELTETLEVQLKESSTDNQNQKSEEIQFARNIQGSIKNCEDGHHRKR